MFNVAVLKMKDIIKYFIGGGILILLVVIAVKYFTSAKEKSEIKTQIIPTSISQNSLLGCLDQTLPVVSEINEASTENQTNDGTIVAEEDNKKNFFQEILKTQISSIEGMEQTEEKQTTNNNTNNENSSDTDGNSEQNEKNNSTNQENIQNNTSLAQTGLPTEIVTPNPITESFNVQYGNVKIKNQTSYNLTEEMLKPDITIENRNVLIFHTHSCESYTSSNAYPYTPTGNFRTTDLNFTVTRVGTELENQLKQYNFNVMHDTSYHDYPAYNGSYTRSLVTVENILKTTPSDIIIDLHRDAIGSRSDYAPAVKIGDTDVAAQIMFVIGTNAGGLWHPNWNQNLKFAIKVQEKAEELYPGLFKPIMLTESRYNQHTGKYASIIEVGATGNTLEQCLTSMKYLAKVLSEI